MKILFKNLLLLLILSLNLTSFSQNFEWVKSAGGVNSDFGRSVTIDSFGFIYTVGLFKDTVDFDPGIGVTQLISNGDKDIFIQKFDSNGIFIWAKSIGGTGIDNVSNVITDASGNIYFGGSYRGTVDFDPGIGVYNLTSSAYQDLYILKLDSGGNFIWVKYVSSGLIGSSTGAVGSVTSDFTDNIYLTGNFRGTVDFDPGIGVSNLTSCNQCKDIFVQKLDYNGNFIWAKSMTGSTNAQSTSIIINDNSLFITGLYYGTVDFDPGIGINQLSSNGLQDIFIQKLDSNGNLIWVKSMGGPGYEYGTSIAYHNKELYCTGLFEDTIDFDPGVGIHQLISNGNKDIFVQKLDSNGNFIWAKSMGGIGDDRSLSIKIGNYNNLYITGYFRNSADLNPGIGVNQLTSNGAQDIFFQSLDLDGNYLFSTSMGGSYSDQTFGLINDNSDNLYLTGTFATTVDFDASLTINNVSSNGSGDIFLTKYSLDSCSTFSIVIDSLRHSTCLDSGFVSCHGINGAGSYSYSWNTTPPTYDSIITTNNAGLYTCTVTDNNGCIKSTNVEIYEQYLDTTYNVKICQGDSILLGGAYQYLPGTYKDTIQSSLICDSIITTILSYGTTYSYISLTICDSSFVSPSGNYTWTANGIHKDTIPNIFGCDSSMTFNLNFDSIHYDTVTVTACGTYISPSNTQSWHSSGTYLDTIFGNYGCDIVTTISLTIIPQNNSSNFTFLNNGLGNYSFTNTSTGSYNQSNWAFGDGSTSSVTSPNYTFNTNGVFVVVLTIKDSISGSSCFDFHLDTVNVTGVPSPSQCTSGFVMYPDTVTGHITVINSSTGNNLSYLWDFGDGNTSTLQNPTYTYVTAGPFNLCLTVDDGAGCIDMYCDSIGKNGIVFKTVGFTINVITPVVIGIDELNILDVFGIYPNPTSTHLTIDTKLEVSRISITDITGKSIKSIISKTNTINVEDLSDGIYFIKIEGEDQSIIRKFVKQ